jgi:phospholipid transport system substrate-binding protein
MKKEKTVSLKRVSCIAGLLSVFCLSLPVWADTPTDTVKNLLDAVKLYKSATNAATAQKVVEGALPVQDLSKEVLGPQWDKLNASDQKSFVQLLRDLLQKIAYPKSAEFFGDLRIEFVNEHVTGADAVVETSVSHPKEGQVTIEYKLHEAGGRWIVNDVLLDSVSLVSNVRSQMQQVITKESYQGLLKRMREKLTES